MIAEYKAGRTPNPDIMCNQEVKFKLFLEAALEDGADMIATGHYARVGHSALWETQSASSGDETRLLTAVDKSKDQTYFLCRVSGESLSKVIFPLGGYTKKEVRAMAEERNLATATKKDSQGICFVGQVGIKEFLSQYVETEPGNIIDKISGKVIGRHEGAIFYTIGQRHGLNVGGGLPYYVVGKDIAKNEVYVTTDLNDDNLWRSKLTIDQVHWINEAPEINENKEFSVRLRYRAPLIKAHLNQDQDGTININLTEPERAVTAGQSAAIYSGETVLGSGIIV